MGHLSHGQKAGRRPAHPELINDADFEKATLKD
jgi:hypothetical protein